MKTPSYSLIIIPPQDPDIKWIHISRRAVVILALAFVVSFLVSVLLCLDLSIDRTGTTARNRLEAENQVLRVENKNIEFQRRRLDAQLARVEETSTRIKSTLAD